MGHQRRALSWILAQLQDRAGSELVVADFLTHLGPPALTRAFVIAHDVGRRAA